jgi:DNA-binding response OmpR family regulator
MVGDRDKCLAAGMDAYVSKPIRKSELLQTIALLTSNRRAGMAPLDAPSETPVGLSKNEEQLR